MKATSLFWLFIIFAVLSLTSRNVCTPAMAKEESHGGTLIDMVCATNPGRNLGKLRSEHTRACLLMPVCAKSGYGLLTDGDRILRFDENGNLLARKIVEKHPHAKTWRISVEGSIQKDELLVQRMHLF